MSLFRCGFYTSKILNFYSRKMSEPLQEIPNFKILLQLSRASCRSQEPPLLIMKRRELKTGIRPHSYLVKDENSNSRFRMHMMSTVVLCKIRKKTFDSCRVLHPTNNLDLSAWVEKSLPPNQVHHPLSPSSITNLWHQSLSPPTNIQNWTIHHVEKGVLQKQNIFLEMKHRHFSWDTRWYTYVPPDIPRKVSVFHFNINFLIY